MEGKPFEIAQEPYSWEVQLFRMEKEREKEDQKPLSLCKFGVPKGHPKGSYTDNLF